MSLVIRAIVTVILLGSAQLAVMHYGQELPMADIGPTKERIESVPLEIGEYEATETTLDEKIFVATQADYMRSLMLHSPEGKAASLSLGIWTNFHLGMPHEPVDCYPANGWTEREVRKITVEAPGCEPIQAWMAAFDRPVDGGAGAEKQEAVVVYWGQLGGKVVLDRNDIRAAKQALRGSGLGELPPLVKVHLHVEAATVDIAADQAANLANVLRGLTHDL